jgi:hypothetical protein
LLNEGVENGGGCDANDDDRKAGSDERAHCVSPLLDDASARIARTSVIANGNDRSGGVQVESE